MEKEYTYNIYKGNKRIYTNQSGGGLLRKFNTGFYTGFEVPVFKKISLDMGAYFLYDSSYKDDRGNNYISVFSLGVLYKL